MAQKDQKLIFERAPYVDLVVGPGQLHQIPDLLERIAAGGGQQLEVSLDRKAATRQEIADSFESYDPLRDPADAAHAVSGVRADHDRLRQILHLLHRADGSRAGAEPAAATRSWPKPASWPTRAAARSRCWAKPSTAINIADGGRTTRLADLLARLHEIDGLDRLKFVTNYPKDMTDDLLAGRARSAQVFPLSARAGPERIEPDLGADEAGLHGRGISRDARPACARRFPARR